MIINKLNFKASLSRSEMESFPEFTKSSVTHITESWIKACGSPAQKLKLKYKQLSKFRTGRK